MRPVRRPRVHVQRARASRWRRVVAAAERARRAIGDRGQRGDDGAADDAGRGGGRPARPSRASTGGVVGRRRVGQVARRGRRGETSFSVGDDDPAGRRIDRHEVGDGDHHAAGGAGRRDAGRRVLDRDALRRVDAEPLGGQEVRLGVRLAVRDLVAGDDGVEPDRRQRVDDGVDQPAPRHRDERARHAERR